MVSLFYVAQQIRDNTIATSASAYQSLTEHITGITLVISSDGELAEFIGRVGRNPEPLPDATDTMRTHCFGADTLFRTYDNIFQRSLGALSEERTEGLLRMPLVHDGSPIVCG